MNKLGIVVIAIIAISALTILGVITAHVGGTSIRTSGQIYSIGELTASTSSILPGVPVTLSFEEGNVEIEGASSVVLVRLPQGSLEIGTVPPQRLATGSFDVTVPCSRPVSEGAGSTVRLLLVDTENQGVLAQSDLLELLPPGPDCLFE